MYKKCIIAGGIILFMLTSYTAWQITGNHAEERKYKKYIQKNLTEEDYGGSCYKGEQFYVYLKNSLLREELQQQGMICLWAEYSYQELKEVCHELNSRKKECGIASAAINEEENCVDVNVNNWDVFLEKTKSSDLGMIQVHETKNQKGSYEKQSDVNDALKINNKISAEEGIEYVKNSYHEQCAVLEEDSGEIELGQSIQIYNVDNAMQSSYIFFPVYMEGKLEEILSVQYYDGQWKYNDYSWRWLDKDKDEVRYVLDKINLENENYVFYSINNKFYAENEWEKVCVAENVAQYQFLLSQEEDEFIRKSYEEKKEEAENAVKMVCDMKHYADKDELNILIG